METHRVEYPMPTNVPARALDRLIDRLIKLARHVDALPRYASLDDNFGALMLERTLSDLRGRPYPYRSEDDYWQEAQRRFWYITRRNAQWKRSERVRARETLLDERGWEIEDNRRHLVGSIAERNQGQYDPERCLLEEASPSRTELLAALAEVGVPERPAMAWVLFRWEDTESYHELKHLLREEIGEEVPEATLRQWERRIYRDPGRMARLYQRVTGEAPTADMMARLAGQKRFSSARRSAQSPNSMPAIRARQNPGSSGALRPGSDVIMIVVGPRTFSGQSTHSVTIPGHVASIRTSASAPVDPHRLPSS